MQTLSLQDYMKVHDLTNTGLSKLTGISKQSVNYWIKPDKDRVFVEYNVITGQILRVYTEKNLYRAETRWDA